MKMVSKVNIIIDMLYALAAIMLVGYLAIVDILTLPLMLLIIIGFIFMGLAIILMQFHKIIMYMADVIAVVMIIISLCGVFYVHQINSTLSQMVESSVAVEQEVISVYVMNDDEAEVLDDMGEYSFGVVENAGDSVTAAIADMEEFFGTSVKLISYVNTYEMVDALWNDEIDAIIINEVYISLLADEESYQWVETDIRKISESYHEIIIEEEVIVVPDDISETFVVYISGIDTYGSISSRSRSDVNILAAVNTVTKEIALISTPRDSYVTFSATNGAYDKLTHAGIYGVDASMDALTTLYDVDIDYYVRVNFSGFVDIIDALGGITVYSENEFTVENIGTYYVGDNYLTGLEALAFARERYSFSDGDYQRAENQMAVIEAVIDKMTSVALLENFTDILTGVSGSFETNMPKDQMTDLVKMQLTDMETWEISNYTTSGTSMYAETYSMPGSQLYVIDLSDSSIAEAQAMLDSVLESGESEEVVE